MNLAWQRVRTQMLPGYEHNNRIGSEIQTILPLYILHLQSIVSLASVADRYGGKLLGNIRNQMQT